MKLGCATLLDVVVFTNQKLPKLSFGVFNGASIIVAEPIKYLAVDRTPSHFLSSPEVGVGQGGAGWG